ncbi:Serine-rich and transmembrane domain-containing protein 1 [Bagarius yarrelli]|uniref:Serine-rich and transmembrane domain-containing protein 1 n=1 Tax=Bagarius yarrelli TaxID=175774 RepID=A0A556VC95_BAGYA|nr:Serine-rich and transmembrane domain-containing protein 1 [Bagarius yarrelli]
MPPGICEKITVSVYNPRHPAISKLPITMQGATAQKHGRDEGKMINKPRGKGEGVCEHLSDMDGRVEELNGTELEGHSFPRFNPTTLSNIAAAASSNRTENVFVYLSIFLSLLLFLLTLLVITLHRLKNIISSSSSYPDCNREAGSAFTNMEICSLSSQRSTLSSLSC